MAEIFKFPPKADESKTERHGTGLAFCILCKHEWQAVAPLGTTQLQCPKCESHKGRFKFPFDPPEGTMRRVCNCGNDLFLLTTEGHLCANCGTYQSY